jgi:hypothetical protein
VGVISRLLILGAMGLLAAGPLPASAQVSCPDGSYVGRGPCRVCPGGTYVGAGESCQTTPKKNVPARPGSPRGTPGGSDASGAGNTVQCPDGSYVTGRRCVLAPDGSYIGRR